jgi:uncharacterized membrane protein
MRSLPLLASILALGACGRGDDQAAAPPSEPSNQMDAASAPSANDSPPPPAPPTQQVATWSTQAGSDGSVLVLAPPSGTPVMRLICPPNGKLLVNLPGIRAVGSEERLSFGGGGHAVALVADSRGDRQRGGVTGSTLVPADMAALIAGPISASYGAQTSGPHPAPPLALAKRFAAACAPAPKAVEEAATSGPCSEQSGARLSFAPLRAVGTEPFWGARIEGRCVTYSTPEDQGGTRIWSRYTAGARGAGDWLGAYRGKPFALRLRPGACSDGMSDRRYSQTAELVVDGGKRSGCAGPP